MSDRRQKDQLVLAFDEEYRGEAPNGPDEGTESLAAKRGTESPAIGKQLMEEVCERENCKQALARVKANQGSAGVDGMTVQQLPEHLKQSLASDPGTVVERGLCAATGEAGGDPEAGRRGAKAGHPNGAGSVHSAGGNGSSATQMGPDVLRTQSGVSSWALGASGSGQGAAVHRGRLPLGCGSGSGEVLGYGFILPPGS